MSYLKTQNMNIEELANADTAVVEALQLDSDVGDLTVISTVGGSFGRAYAWDSIMGNSMPAGTHASERSHIVSADAARRADILADVVKLVDNGESITDMLDKDNMLQRVFHCEDPRDEGGNFGRGKCGLTLDAVFDILLFSGKSMTRVISHMIAEMEMGETILSKRLHAMESGEVSPMADSGHIECVAVLWKATVLYDRHLHT